MSNSEDSIAPPAPTPTTRDAAQDLLIEQWSRGPAASAPAAREPFPNHAEPVDPYAPPVDTSLTPPASSDIGTGLALMVVGIIITVVTYNAAAGGGVYVVAWGPVVYGFLRLMRGLTR